MCITKKLGRSIVVTSVNGTPMNGDSASDNDHEHRESIGITAINAITGSFTVSNMLKDRTGGNISITPIPSPPAPISGIMTNDSMNFDRLLVKAIH